MTVVSSLVLKGAEVQSEQFPLPFAARSYFHSHQEAHYRATVASLHSSALVRSPNFSAFKSGMEYIKSVY